MSSWKALLIEISTTLYYWQRREPGFRELLRGTRRETERNEEEERVIGKAKKGLYLISHSPPACREGMISQYGRPLVLIAMRLRMVCGWSALIFYHAKIRTLAHTPHKYKLSILLVSIRRWGPFHRVDSVLTVVQHTNKRDDRLKQEPTVTHHTAMPMRCHGLLLTCRESTRLYSLYLLKSTV